MFLRRTFTEIRHRHLQYHELLLRRVRDLESSSTSPSNSPPSLQRARLELQANTEAMEEIHRTARFKLDLYQTENCSKNFFRPPTPPTLQLAITAVTLPEGSLSKDQSTIARLHRRYWGHIFRSTSRDFPPTPPQYSSTAHGSLLINSTARLTASQTHLLEAPLTARDFYDAITSSARGKAAKPDGHPAEYYQLFPETWSRLLNIVYSAQ